MENIVVVILSWAFASAAFIFGLNTRRVARDVTSWPTVPGILVAKEVVQSRVGSTSTPGRRYTPAIRYTYTVDGRAYTGDRVLHYGNVSGMYDNIRRLVDSFGETVEVRYNPTNPAEACLQPQPAWWVPGLFAVSAFAFFIGFATLVILLAGH